MTAGQVRALAERERKLFGGGEVESSLPALRAAIDREQYRRLLPGYVRRFVTTAAPLIDLRVDGDPDGVFRFAQARRRGLDPVLETLEIYPGDPGRFTIYRPDDRSNIVWLHPGEPVFDRLCATLLARHEGEARRGACFVDPHAREPYLFHLARVSSCAARRPRRRLLRACGSRVATGSRPRLSRAGCSACGRSRAAPSHRVRWSTCCCCAARAPWRRAACRWRGWRRG